MNVIDQHLEKVKRELNPQAIQTALFNQIRLIENNFIQLNKEQIFDLSKDIYGKDIGFYSKATEKITGGAKRAGDPFTGVDSGDWMKGFFMKVDKDGLFFGSTDEKKNKKIFGEKSTWLSKDLFALTDENLNLVIERDVLPFIQNYSIKSLGI